MPEISVVIPSYSHAAYLAEAVQSVLDQSAHDLELIVVDDGSKDNSLEVLAGFSDPRLQVFSQENQGAHAAINRGLHLASGEYLAILNSDDAYHPQRLEKCTQKLKENPSLSLVGSHIEVIDTQGKLLGIKHGYQDLSPWLLEMPERSFRAGDDLGAALLAENYWSTTSNYVFSRRFWQQAGDFRSLRYTHDWDYALRLAQLGSQSLLPEPLVRYRVHPSNTIRENQAAMIFEICWILAVHLPHHFNQPAFTNQVTPQKRLDQLLHSISVFGMERVLNGLLVQEVSRDAALAERLLAPGDPQRETYLDYIRQRLAQAEPPPAPTPPPPAGLLRRAYRRARSLGRRSLEKLGLR